MSTVKCPYFIVICKHASSVVGSIEINKHFFLYFKAMTVFHDEIEIEDFEYDEDDDMYYYPCPCGDRFQISKVRNFKFIFSK